MVVGSALVAAPRSSEPPLPCDSAKRKPATDIAITSTTAAPYSTARLPRLIRQRPSMACQTLDGLDGPGRCCRRPMMSFTVPGPTAGSRIRPPSVVDVVGLGYPPGVATRRTRLLAKLAMYRLPAASTARPSGTRQAWVAGPPSPQKSLVPLPATVVMVPSGATRRTRVLLLSAMYRLPAASTARSVG